MPKNAKKPTSPKRKRTKTKKVTDNEASPKRLSGLDAAVLMLKATGTAMRVPDITKAAIDGGHWAPGGRTPAATLNAAICREVKLKGSAARFVKTGRGLFALAAG